MPWAFVRPGPRFAAGRRRYHPWTQFTQPRFVVDIVARTRLGCITDTKMHADAPKMNPREMNAIRFIGRYTAQFHRAPSVRELGAAVYPNHGTLPVYLIRELRRKGLVSRLRRRHRILSLTPTGHRWFEADAQGESPLLQTA